MIYNNQSFHIYFYVISLLYFKRIVSNNAIIMHLSSNTFINPTYPKCPASYEFKIIFLFVIYSFFSGFLARSRNLFKYFNDIHIGALKSFFPDYKIINGYSYLINFYLIL